MKNWPLIIILLSPFVLKAQIISTFAGGGTGGSGSPATAAFIYDPNGGVFDKHGNYYCAEDLGCKVSKISNTGVYTVIAGTGSAGFSGDGGVATIAQLSLPQAVKLDANGNIYISDAGNSRIRKVDATTGIITTIAGNGSTGFGGDNGPATSAVLNGPGDICFDKSGNLYISEVYNFRIRKINTSGIITTVVGTGTGGHSGDNGPATNATISRVSGLVMDDNGNLYLAGSSLGSNVVRKINTAGIITTVAGVNGSYTYPGDGIAATQAPMSPIKIAVDLSGQLIIADDMNNKVFRVNLAGIIYTIAANGVQGFSGDGGQATAAEIDIPGGVAFDSCGNLYIADVNNRRIRKVTFNPPPCTYLDVKEQTKLDYATFPNPANEVLNIDNLKSQTTYQIKSIFGKSIQQGTLEQGNNTLSLKSLPPGMYLLVLTDEEGERKVSKIIKQ